MTRTNLAARFALALIFALCLPLAAMAGVMDDADGTWKLDAEKTAKANGGPVTPPFDVVVIDKAGNSFTMRHTASGQEHPMPFTVQNPSAASAVLQITNGPAMRLEMKGKNEMCLIGLENGRDQEALCFTR